MKKHPKLCKNKNFPGLTSQQEDFCRQYLIDSNATQAAIRAGYSERSAAMQASRLLNKDKVQEKINRLRAAREKRLEASADFVVRELMRIAKFDIRQAFDKDGSLKAIKDMPDDVARVIAAVDVDELWGPKEEGPGKEQKGYTKKIKAWDKIRALEALGQHFGIFKRPGDLPAEQDPKIKKADLLQVIKILSKDGQTTIIENRVGESAPESDGVVKSGPGFIRIL